MEIQHYRSMEGVTFAMGRISLAFKHRERAADATYSVIESIEPPGAGASLHRHATYDETFIACAGRYAFQVGDERLMLGVGETLFVPRGTPHGFTYVGPDSGRLFTISSPGGIFEAFIRDVQAASVDTGATTHARAFDFRAVAARHGIEFLT